MSQTGNQGHRTGSLYGSFAYASVILTSFAGYFFAQDYFSSEQMVWVSLVLCSAYTALGVLGGGLVDCGGGARAGYYLGQCGLLTALLWLSPIRGFFGIIVLPLVAQAIFDLKRPYALLIALYLYALNISVWAIPFGWAAGTQALLNYAAAFAFTIAFTLITRRALDFQKREEQLRHEIEAAHRKLQAYAAQAEDLATTRERNRLAREIHDGVGHYLTVVKTQLDAAAALIPTQPERARAAVMTAAKLTGEALEDVRRSVGALRTDTARLPLPEAVRQLAAHGEPVPIVAVEGTPRPLPPAIEHALFRAAQEGLTNIRKHARATNALVRLDFSAPQSVRLELADNGVGTAAGVAPGGFGLTGIRERIELLGGRVESGNRAAGGFALSVEVPT